MSESDDGLLGGLPRERPGRRSARRAQTPGPDVSAPRPPRSAEPEAEPSPDAPSASAPLPDAVRLAGSVASGGVRLAARASAGILRRLPRP